jgi:Zn-dependent protease with chaperone function
MGSPFHMATLPAVSPDDLSPQYWLMVGVFGLLCVVPLALTYGLRRRAVLEIHADDLTSSYRYRRRLRLLILGTWLACVLIPVALGMPIYVVVELLFAGALVLVGCELLSYPVYRAFWEPELKWRRCLFRAVLVQGLYLQAALNLVAACITPDEPAFAYVMLKLALGVFVNWFLLGMIVRNLSLFAWMVRRRTLRKGKLLARAHELAQRAGVKLGDFGLIRCGDYRFANAFASWGKSVTVTDSLVRLLSLREVDAVLAHELGHLRLKHLVKFAGAFMAIWYGSMIVGATILVKPANNGGLHRIADFGLYSWASLAGGLFVALLLMRRFEFQADREAATLTGDPESLCTGLLKLCHYHGYPLCWTAWERPFMSHPSTMERIEALARSAGWPREKIESILETPIETTSEADVDADLLGDAPEVARVFTRKARGRMVARRLATVLGLLFGVPLLSALLVDQLLPATPWRWASLGLVVPAAMGCLLLLDRCFDLSNFGRRFRGQLLATLAADGTPIEDEDAMYVSLAPGPELEYYDGLRAWDCGFLLLDGDSLNYLGDQTRFAIARENVVAVRLRPGPSDWCRRPRLVLVFQDEANGAERSLLLWPAEAESAPQWRASLSRITTRVESWLHRELATSPRLWIVLPPPPLWPVTPDARSRLTAGQFLFMAASLGVYVWCICWALRVSTSLAEGCPALQGAVAVIAMMVFDRAARWFRKREEWKEIYRRDQPGREYPHQKDAGLNGQQEPTA